jgi:hypothetical protein
MFMFLKISFTYTKNSRGPKTLLCSTPEVTLTSLDSSPPTLTLYVRPTRNSLTQTTTLKSTPEAASFVSSRSWGISRKPWKSLSYLHLYRPPRLKSPVCAGTLRWFDFHMSIPNGPVYVSARCVCTVQYQFDQRDFSRKTLQPVVTSK